MIPKTIHYVRFGNKSIPQKHQEYISGRKKILPDYTFILRNESNFDVTISTFTKQVAEKQKRGFIVDYIRAYAVYNYGGIYLDTDVELLKSLDGFLHHECFGGFEDENHIAPGLIFGGEKGATIAKEILDFYNQYEFIDKDGNMKLTASPQIFTQLLLKYGLKQEDTYQDLGVFTAYPAEYFCPKSFGDKIHITKNTASIHHYEMSRLPIHTKLGIKAADIIGKVFGKKAGEYVLHYMIDLNNALKKFLQLLRKNIKLGTSNK